MLYINLLNIKTQAAFLASFNNSKTLFERYFCLKGLFLFLSGCVFINAFLHITATPSGLSNSDNETGCHSGQISCKVDNNVVKLFIVLAPEYPHFY